MSDSEPPPPQRKASAFDGLTWRQALFAKFLAVWIMMVLTLGTLAAVVLMARVCFWIVVHAWQVIPA